MQASASVLPEKGEKPYEFCWRLHFEDGSVVTQYEGGFINLFAKQDQTGLKGISIFRHSVFEPEQLVPGRGALKHPTPIYIPCQAPIDIRYRGRMQEKDLPNGERKFVRTRKQMVVTTDWCKVVVTPSGFEEFEWRPEGDKYSVVIVPVEGGGGGESSE